MKCPRCEKEMKEGFVTLGTSENANLWWSEEEPPSLWQEVLIDFRLRDKWKHEILMRNTLLHHGKEERVRKGFRCSNCRIVFFEY